ncbi:hypothetical protein D3C71_1383530 [compost metagenome]
MQAEEQLLYDLMMERLIGPGVQIVGESQPVEAIRELPVIAVRDYSRSYALLHCLDGDRCAVAVAAGHIQHLLAFGPVIARKHIAGQHAGQPPEVQRTVGIRPGASDEYFAHVHSSFPCMIPWLHQSQIPRPSGGTCLEANSGTVRTPRTQKKPSSHKGTRA